MSFFAELYILNEMQTRTMEDDLIFKEIQYNRIRVHLEIGQSSKLRRVYKTI